MFPRIYYISSPSANVPGGTMRGGRGTCAWRHIINLVNNGGACRSQRWVRDIGA